MWEGFFGVYDGRMTTTDDAPEMSGGVDFSDDSVDTAFFFVRGCLNRAIDALTLERDMLADMRDRNSSIYPAAVIAIANQYKESPAFQPRWDLKEKK